MSDIREDIIVEVGRLGSLAVKFVELNNELVKKLNS